MDHNSQLDSSINSFNSLLSFFVSSLSLDFASIISTDFRSSFLLFLCSTFFLLLRCLRALFSPSYMESSATLRSFHYFAGGSRLPLIEKPCKISVSNANKSCTQGVSIFGKPAHTPTRQRRTIVLCTKTPEVTDTAKPNDGVLQGSVQKKPAANATFPNGFEALVLEVCDETEIAELKLKVGEFEMHLKRNIGIVKAPMSAISPTIPPPIPSKPMVESVPAAPAPPKSSPEKKTAFTNVSFEKSSKLAALEASGSKGYVLVSSPTVGSFRRGRTVKGKKQPPICKENDLIKEGQVIGYVDQFGTELPVKTDVAGEVLKVLFKEGEAVGYGDPLIAVLPAFHGIN